jgi:hypothetical protein
MRDNGSKIKKRGLGENFSDVINMISKHISKDIGKITRKKVFLEFYKIILSPRFKPATFMNWWWGTGWWGA